MASDEDLEGPSAPVIFLIVVVACLGLLLLCSSVAQRLRRSRNTRSLIERLTNRLHLSSIPAEASYPAARPSKYMRRFAGISVVDGNAMVDEVHYEQLREFPEALVEVEEVATNVDSADFSASEVATTATSIYSRSGHRHRHSHSHSGHRQGREGSLSSEPSPYGESSWSRFPSMMVEAEEMNASRGGLEAEEEGESRDEGEWGGVEQRRVSSAGHFHCVPPTTNRELGSDDGSNHSVDEFGAQPMSRQRSSALAAPMASTSVTMPSSPVQHTGSGGLGRCVITNISVEDLAAHCAAQHDDEEEDEGATRKQSPPPPQGSGDVPLDVTAAQGTREGATTPLTPYAYIMREKVRKAAAAGGGGGGGHARSVVVVEPERSSGDSSAAEGESIDATGLHASSSCAKATTAADAELTRRHRRTVHREHHHHHTSKGGFIVVEDFVPDLASRRMRREQTAAKKPRFVFQLRNEETLYGRSDYQPRQAE